MKRESILNIQLTFFHRESILNIQLTFFIRCNIKKYNVDTISILEGGLLVTHNNGKRILFY